jgi:hypothetical protein
MGVLLQMVQQNDDKHEAGHHRLRTDYRALEQRVVMLEAARVAGEMRFTKIESTPPDVTKLQFSPRTVVAIVGACVALAAGQWGLNTRLEGNVKAMIDQNSRVQDERYASMQKTIDGLKNRMELSQIELNTFKENLLRDLGIRRTR